MAKKASCIKCNNATIGFYDGNLMTLKRKEWNFIIQGKDATVLAPCPRCGQLNSIGMQMVKNEAGEETREFTASGEISDITSEEIIKLNENKEEQNAEENKQGEQGDRDESGDSGESGDAGGNSGGEADKIGS